MQKRSAWGILIVLIVAGVLLALFVQQILSYRASLRVLPEGTSVAGMDVSGMTVEQAVAALEGVYAQPVQLYYQEQLLELTPDSVGLQFDPEATRAAIEAAVAGRRSFDGLMTYLLRRPTVPIDVTPTVTFSAERLDGFLQRVAQQYDRPPLPLVALPEALAFRAGQAGYEMDRAASHAQIAQALVSASERRAALVIRVQEAPEPDIAQLEEVLDARLAGFNGIAGVFVKDLQTGAELSINGDVAYSGNDMLQLAVALETFRVLEQLPTVEQMTLLTQTLTQGDRAAANQLLQDVVGGGDVYQGVENLNLSMNYLGLVNTFMATPYDDVVVPPAIVTPANSRADVSTQPDPHMQTTARDMGLLLEMVYQCSRGGGALPVAYPGAFSAHECQQLLDILAGYRSDSFIELGLPPAMAVAHKLSISPETHADGGIVFSPNGDFVLVVFLYSPQWLDWTVSNPLITDVATATYNYFNPTP